MAWACGTLLPQSGPFARRSRRRRPQENQSTSEPCANFAVSFLMRAQAQENSFHIQVGEMLKKHTAACLVATAFIAAPALAQTSGSGSTSAAPAASSAAGAQSGQFMTQ